MHVPSKNKTGESTRTTKKKFALLESVAARFQQQNDERQKRTEKLEMQRELEKVHSRYLKQNVVDHTDLYEAKFVVDQWTKKHDSSALRHGRRILKPKRSRQTERTWNLDNPVSSVNFSHQSRTSATAVSAARGRPENKVRNEEQIPKDTGMDINDSVIVLDSSLEGDIAINTESSQIPSNKELRCPIVNCCTKFTSTDMMLRHMYRFAHCPCNPLAEYPDCDLEGKNVGFACPQCWSIFQTKQFCSDHMRAEDHRTYLAALELVGYLCGECLSIFPSLAECTSHIENTKHDHLSYPFHEDMKQGGKQSRPVAVTKAMAKHFYNKCQDARFEVKCTDCGLLIKTDRGLTLHNIETDKQHIMSTTAEQTQVDIFLHYLCYGFCCDACGSLCPAPQSVESWHTCCSECNVLGAVKEFQCNTFVEFVRHCCIMCEIEENTNISNCVNYSSKSKKTKKKKRNETLPDVPQDTELSVPISSSKESMDINVESSNCVNNSSKSKKKEKKKRNETLPDVPQDTEMCVPISSSKESMDINVESSSSDCDIMEVDNSVPGKVEIEQSSSTGASKSATLRATSYNITNNVICDNVPSGRSTGTDTVIQQCVRELTLPSKSNQLEKISSDALVDLTHLSKMKNIVFLDLDNWGGFFQKLPEPLCDKTFVWAFYGGTTVWKEPLRCLNYLHQRNSGRFCLHQKCGRRKDAADFAICLKVGQMDEKLPKSVAFTILSGDRGFQEIEEQMKKSDRHTVVVDPHDAQSMGDYVLYAMINSVGDT